MFSQQVHPPQYCPSVLALVIKYTIRMANVEANNLRPVIVKFPGYFHLHLHAKAYLYLSPV